MKRISTSIKALALAGAIFVSVGYAGSADYETEACYTRRAYVDKIEACDINANHDLVTFKADNGDWVCCQKANRFEIGDKVVLIIDEKGTTYDLDDDEIYKIRKVK